VFWVSFNREGRALGVEESMRKAEIASKIERSTLMVEVSWSVEAKI
jgi:hypothetical protein